MSSGGLGGNRNNGMTDPKSFGMSPIDFASYNHAEWYPAGFGARVKDRLTRFGRKNVHILIIHQDDPLL